MTREMNRLPLIAVIALAILNTLGCTDTERASLAALGNAHHVVCYSGEKVIYEGNSTGRVQSPKESDGWQFEDAKTHLLTEVSGNCVITVLP